MPLLSAEAKPKIVPLFHCRLCLERVQQIRAPSPASFVRCFNPHPALRRGATGNGLSRCSSAPVSILTPHSGGVQRAQCNQQSQRREVSILTPHSGGVQPHPDDVRRRLPVVSILTPHSGGVQRLGRGAWRPGRNYFNPHPALRRGATQATEERRHCLAVSILTPHSGGVQRPNPYYNGSTLWFQSSPRTQAGCN